MRSPIGIAGYSAAVSAGDRAEFDETYAARTASRRLVADVGGLRVALTWRRSAFVDSDMKVWLELPPDSSR